MIIYEGIKEEFVNDIEAGILVDKLYTSFQEKIGRTSRGEIRSWQNSMQYMYMVLNDEEIPCNSGVAIEYKLPTSSKRIDFILSGTTIENHDSAIIIELKQWSEVQKVDDEDGIVRTFLNGGLVKTPHPSYQVWTYSSLINDYNESVQQDDITLYPCAYLHNYRLEEDDPLIDSHYQGYTEKAPVFTVSDVNNLREFIKRYIHVGDNKSVLYKIENGRIRPSKSLQDSLAKMLQGNEEFTMIDEQKVVYETAKKLAHEAYTDNEKRVLIVKGGPGTGKSVLAINLLVELTGKEMVCQYVTKNSAPRHVYSAKLKGNMKKSSIDNLFKGSGIYVDAIANEIDAVIVDEAHRLNEKSGMFQNLGENQMKEIINASKLSVFFIDEYQRIHFKDSGRVDTIINYANAYGAQVSELELTSQFRCNGSDGYLAWIDDVLDIRQTANSDGFELDYDIQMIDDPNTLRSMIIEKNKINNKARLLAGYCWNWEKAGRSNSSEYDISIPEYEFKMSWNLDNSPTFAIDKDSVYQVGCIHTSQGLEFDYVGIIIGKDLRCEKGKIITDFKMRAKTDQSLKGIKKLYKEDKLRALEVANEIIKNTYRTLMTRGQKGCYIFCEDKELQEYMKKRLKSVNELRMNKYNYGYKHIAGKVADEQELY